MLNHQPVLSDILEKKITVCAFIWFYSQWQNSLFQLFLFWVGIVVQHRTSMHCIKDCDTMWKIYIASNVFLCDIKRLSKYKIYLVIGSDTRSSFNEIQDWLLPSSPFPLIKTLFTAPSRLFPTEVDSSGRREEILNSDVDFLHCFRFASVNF